MEQETSDGAISHFPLNWNISVFHARLQLRSGPEGGWATVEGSGGGGGGQVFKHGGGRCASPQEEAGLRLHRKKFNSGRLE